MVMAAQLILKRLMPLLRIDEVGHGAKLGLWQMTESVGQLPMPSVLDLTGVRSENRIREILVTYQMLYAIMGRDDLRIRHEASGKPVVEGYNISISHTRGWAAMILAEKRGDSHKVGVDIEYFSDRVNRIASRFIREDEQNTDLAHRIINWSAKETVYKMFAEEDLRYFEMRLRHFEAHQEGEVFVDDLKCDKTIAVNYILNQDYAFTWSSFMLSSKK